MRERGGSSRAEQGTLQFQDGGATPTPPLAIEARDLKVSVCNLKEIRNFIETHHYSRSVNGVKVAHCFRVEHQGRLVGAVLFGAMSTTAWKRFAAREECVLELRRLVLLDAAGKNSESRVIGVCLRHIRRHSSVVEAVVSYADPRHGHQGVIYRASNFEYVGLSGKDRGFLDTTTGKTHHSRGLRTKYKGEYKPFVVRLRERLALGLLVPVDLPPKHCFLFTLRKPTP